jgi:hypothetical protein
VPLTDGILLNTKWQMVIGMGSLNGNGNGNGGKLSISHGLSDCLPQCRSVLLVGYHAGGALCWNSVTLDSIIDPFTTILMLEIALN